MQQTPTFKAYWVLQEGEQFSRQVVDRLLTDLPQNEVLIRVHYAGLNYKDALSAQGHKGVTKHYPHTPGIDASGVVAESSHPDFQPGQEVLVTGYDLGMNTPGGFAEYIRVPAAWVVHKPAGLSLRDCMVIGTAGFTAALALYKMEKNGQHPDMGPILVTGASGGVGSLALSILHRAGYQSIASTGSADAIPYLENLGASQCISREETDDNSGKPLLHARWAGAIDNVGGNTLATAIKACQRNGNIAVCGNVRTVELHSTVFPFILKGINLLGIDSAEASMKRRLKLWECLATTWKPQALESSLFTEIGLEQLDTQIDLILKGQTRGRVVVNLTL